MARKRPAPKTASAPHANTGNSNSTGPALRKGNPGKRDLRINLMQEMFAQAYARTGKVGQSAVEAGYSAENASAVGSGLMKHPKVQARISELVNERLEALGYGKEHFFVGVARQASASLSTTIPDIAEFDDSGLNLKDSKSLTDRQRLAIKKVTSSPGQNGAAQGIELHDPVPLVALLAKLGGWEAPAKTEVTAVSTVTTTTDTSTMTDEQLQAHIASLLKQP